MEISPEKLNLIQNVLNAKSIDNKPRVLKGVAKHMTIFVLMGTFLLGSLGSFDFVPFDMTAYVLFLENFMWLFLALILSIGTNSVVKTIKEKENVQKPVEKN